jgi:hypothetical protein
MDASKPATDTPFALAKQIEAANCRTGIRIARWGRRRRPVAPLLPCP